MSQFKKFIAGGILRAELGFYDSAGFMCGAAGALANGEDSGMLRWRGMKSVDATFPEETRVTQTGDDQKQGTLTFPSTDPLAIAIQMGVNDMDTEALLMNVNVYDDGQFEHVPIDPFIEEYPLACLWVQSTAKRREIGQRASKGIVNHVFIQGEPSVRGFDGLTERELQNYDYFMSLDQVSVYPWGAIIADANEGTEAMSADKFVSDKLVTLHAFRGDGSTDTVTLDFTPAGTHTTPAGVFAVWSTNPTTGAVTELDPTTGFTVAGNVVTFVAPPAAGHHVVIRYKIL